MRWKTKARITNLLAQLPESLSYDAYFWLQRRIGGLRTNTPSKRISSAVEAWRLLQDSDIEPEDKVFFEIGTGRVPLAPLSFWLMGARRTITVDLNPYVRSEMIEATLAYISNNSTEIEGLFGSLLDSQRFDKLLQYSRLSTFSLSSFLDLCQIEYLAPADASNSRLDPDCIDIVTSFRVLEHIPAEVIANILTETKRLIRVDGVCLHRVDYSDHFSHSDKSISSVNFLQFDDAEWDRLAGNRYMYMNRLRHQDFLNLFQSLGFRLLRDIPDIDQTALDLLSGGEICVDDRFIGKDPRDLATRGAWLLADVA